MLIIELSTYLILTSLNFLAVVVVVFLGVILEVQKLTILMNRKNSNKPDWNQDFVRPKNNKGKGC